MERCMAEGDTSMRRLYLISQGDSGSLRDLDDGSIRTMRQIVCFRRWATLPDSSQALHHESWEMQIESGDCQANEYACGC